jgi:hypothetical protein
LIRRFGRSVAREPLLVVSRVSAKVSHRAVQRLPNKRPGRKASATCCRHSSAKGAAANRGTATSIDGKVVSPVASTSLLPEEKSIAQSFMAAANDLVSRTQRSAS